MSKQESLGSITEEQYHSLCAENAGICRDCGELSEQFCEPDAEEYPCQECGADAVCGLENAMIDGTLVIT